MMVIEGEGRQKMEEIFFANLYRCVTVENHAYKFKGWKDVANILNDVAEDMKIDIDFRYKLDPDPHLILDDVICPFCTSNAFDYKEFDEYFEYYCMICNTPITINAKYRWSVSGKNVTVTNMLPYIYSEFKRRYRFQEM